MCVQLEMIRQMMDAETKKLDKCAVLVQSFWRGLQERRVIQVRAVIRGACTSRRHTPQHLFLPCASCKTFHRARDHCRGRQWVLSQRAKNCSGAR